MPLIFTQKVATDKEFVTTIYSQPELLPANKTVGGTIVPYIPNAEIIEGKTPKLYFNPTSQELWYEYVDRPLSQEEILSQWYRASKSANQQYTELDKVTTPLEDLKAAKLKALDEMCNYTIVSGFDHTVGETVYHFSGSLAAQANFTGTKVRFMANEITEVEWTAVNKTTGKEERIILDPVTFKPIADKMFDLVDSSIKKLRNTLQPQVETITEETRSTIDTINW